MSKEYKLNIFEVLGNIDKKNINYFNTLSEEEQKAFSPLVVMRWLTGNKNKLVTFLVNEIVNPYVFSLGNHKRLLFELMTIAAQNDGRRFSWIKKGNTSNSFKRVIIILSEYLECPIRKAIEALDFYTNAEIIQMAEELGKQKDEIQILKKELGKRQ